MNLAPQDFWSLTPSEWRWLCAGEGGGMRLHELEALVRLYPDERAPFGPPGHFPRERGKNQQRFSSPACGGGVGEADGGGSCGNLNSHEETP